MQEYIEKQDKISSQTKKTYLQTAKTLPFNITTSQPTIIKKLKESYPFYGRRLKIRPGVTGWAQINQPFDTNIKDVHQKLKYD